MKKTKIARAFSLVELAVALGIIMLLAAILTPVFVSAKEASKRSASLSSLKQLHLAISLYRQEWEGGGGAKEGLGLPPLSPFGTAEAALPGTAALWFSPCGWHPDGPFENRRGRIHALYGDEVPWWNAYMLAGESTPLIADFHCNGQSVTLETPFEPYRVQYVTMMGSAVSKMTAGRFKPFDLR